MESDKQGRWRGLLLAAKLIVVALVTWGLWRNVSTAFDEARASGFSLWQLRPAWLALAGLLYILGMLPMGWFWHRLLVAMGQRPRLAATLRAYYLGHLGKYVPGKALVVVLRTGAIRGEGVAVTPAAVAVFLETLTMMAVGAAIAAAIIAARFGAQRSLLILSLILMVLAGIPTLPPVARRIVVLLRIDRADRSVNDLLRGVNWRVMAIGWLSNLVGWTLLGLSLWATLRALPLVDGRLATGVSTHLLLMAAVSLAVVAGFLSLLPGGIGVREWVLMPLLAVQMQLGELVAVVAAISLRLAWLLSEVIVSVILYLVVSNRSKRESG